MCEGMHTCARAHTERLENNSRSGLSFHLVGFRNQTQSLVLPASVLPHLTTWFHLLTHFTRSLHHCPHTFTVCASRSLLRSLSYLLLTEIGFKLKEIPCISLPGARITWVSLQFLFFSDFPTQGFSVLYRPGWPQSHRDLPASAS